MSHKKIYSYDDVYPLFREYAEIIDNRFKEINKNKNITHPTNQEYENFLKNILEKLNNIVKCIGIHMTGKHRNQRCQAPPHPGSKYCLRHKNQGEDIENTENKESDKPKTLEEALKQLEILKKSKSNEQ